MRYLEDFKPRRLLVLGSRLGEPTSFWDRRFVATEGFVHVDVDPDVPGVAFGAAPTLAVVGDIGATLRAVLTQLRPSMVGAVPALPRPRIERVQLRHDGLVRPEALMDALQDWVVDRSTRHGACPSRATRSCGRRIGCGFRRRIATAPAPGLARWVTPPPVSSVPRWPAAAAPWPSSATGRCS